VDAEMPSAAGSSVLSTNAFLNGIGVDTHIPYTDGGYANLSNVLADLRYLGLNQVRDGLTDGQNGSAPFASFETLAKAGVQFTFVAQASTSAELSALVALYDQLQQAAPGSVAAVEGANEINNQPVRFDGVGGIQGALDLQAALYKAVHGDPLLAGTAVDYFTGYGAPGAPQGPDPATTPGLADYDNQHPYALNGTAPAFWLARAHALTNTASPTTPAVYTETGYSTATVDQAVQAKYTLDLLFDAAAQGISRTYLYELLDAYGPGSPQGDAGFGLFDDTGAPKLAATAIHNLTSIVGSATASGAAPTPLEFTVGGLPSTGQELLLQKPDGTHVIALWAEPQIWDAGRQAEVAAPSETATVELPQAYGQVLVYDPLAGTAPIAGYSNAQAVQVALTDHPLLIQLGSAGAGDDLLVVNLSEIPAGGHDAQVAITVDGQQIGGLHTITALRSAGQDQNVVLQGDFGPGPHTVGVTFINGFAGDLADAGREVFVNAVTLDNETRFENTALMFRNPVAYHLQAPASPPPANAGTQDTLSFDVSEADPDGGDAQFMVAVDGQIVGGIHTVTAQQAQGQSQTITVTGDFGPGPHAVTVDFVNGFSGDPRDDNRELYLHSITLDGATTVENAAMRYVGAQRFEGFVV
jgi:hypothetical protein